jgi:hypothetical protein
VKPDSRRRKQRTGPPGGTHSRTPASTWVNSANLTDEEWEGLPTVPKVRLEKEPQGRLRWFESDEERRLIAACRASALPHLADLVTVALETGCGAAKSKG